MPRGTPATWRTRRRSRTAWPARRSRRAGCCGRRGSCRAAPRRRRTPARRLNSHAAAIAVSPTVSQPASAAGTPPGPSPTPNSRERPRRQPVRQRRLLHPHPAVDLGDQPLLPAGPEHLPGRLLHARLLRAGDGREPSPAQSTTPDASHSSRPRRLRSHVACSEGAAVWRSATWEVRNVTRVSAARRDARRRRGSPGSQAGYSTTLPRIINDGESGICKSSGPLSRSTGRGRSSPPVRRTLSF